MQLNVADGQMKPNKMGRDVVLDLATRGQLLFSTWLSSCAPIHTSGSSEAKKSVTSPSEEELKETLERPETPQPPRPPVVVDHQRLLVI